MQNLNQDWLKTQSSPQNFTLPEKVLQFGTGNFLRGYADWMIDLLNSANLFEGRIAVVQSSQSSSADKINQQQGLYTVIERDHETEKVRLITSLSRVLKAQEDWAGIEALAISPDLSLILSNTTEAGITYVKEDHLPGECQESFPAKLTALLYKRFQTLGHKSGLIICPMELIENNGTILKQHILSHATDWGFEDDFTNYIHHECEFNNTLVDRIVSGYPEQDKSYYENKLGYEDANMLVCEPYHLLVIENGEKLRSLLPLEKLELNVIFTDNLDKYRDAKVRFLNGAHTSSILSAYLCGCTTVLDMMQNPTLNKFLTHVLSEEISPGVSLSDQECQNYVNTIINRFSNPTLNHRLLDIALNSLSKWKVRVLPSIKSYLDITHKLPEGLCFSLAALIYFYQKGLGNSLDYSPQDDQAKLEVIKGTIALPIHETCRTILSSTILWEEDLTKYQGLLEQLTQNLSDITNIGLEVSLNHFVSKIN